MPNEDLSVDVKELIKSGNLGEARAVLVDRVKNSPADDAGRTLLLQVLCFLGEWEKARRHVEVLSGMGNATPGLSVIGDLIAAEQERQKASEHNKPASFLTDPPDYLSTFISMREHLTRGDAGKAEELFRCVEQLRPEVSGTLDGNPFRGISDTDTFLFPFLEAFVHGRYLWFPFEALRQLSISPPARLHDMLWIPASIVTWEGLSVNCFLPVLYPGSYAHQDERVRMGHVTVWASVGGPFVRGAGQHVFVAGEEDIPLLNIRELTFDFAAS